MFPCGENIVGVITTHIACSTPSCWTHSVTFITFIILWLKSIMNVLWFLCGSLSSSLKDQIFSYTTFAIFENADFSMEKAFMAIQICPVQQKKYLLCTRLLQFAIKAFPIEIYVAKNCILFQCVKPFFVQQQGMSKTGLHRSWWGKYIGHTFYCELRPYNFP